jgi:hypothetical protein
MSVTSSFISLFSRDKVLAKEKNSDAKQNESTVRRGEAARRPAAVAFRRAERKRGSVVEWGRSGVSIF